MGITEITTDKQRRELGIRRFVIESDGRRHVVVIESRTDAQHLPEGPPIWKQNQSFNRDTAAALAPLVCKLLDQPLRNDLGAKPRRLPVS